APPAPASPGGLSTLPAQPMAITNARTRVFILVRASRLVRLVRVRPAQVPDGAIQPCVAVAVVALQERLALTGAEVRSFDCRQRHDRVGVARPPGEIVQAHDVRSDL